MARVTLHGGAADLDTGVFHGTAGRTKLTTKERELLAYLVARPGVVVTREELLQSVWGYHPEVRSRAVDKTLTRLRAKLGDDGRDPLHLHTVHGVGYRFEPLHATAVAAPPAPSLTTTDPPFVGRAAELARLREAVDDGTRAIGIVGVAGVGKTRLLAEFLVRWPGPSLAVHASKSLLDTLCELLELPVPADAGPTERLEQLGRALSARGRLVLALDGVERALDELREALPRLLELAPALTLVATSRRALPLDRALRLDVGSLSDDAAVELFLARARARRADFAFSDDEEARKLVGRLDGLPLAIELAAARAGVLSARQLIQRLDHRFELLREGLVSALDTSWDLLRPAERSALSQCALFKGGFDLAAAEGVIRVPGDDVLGALESLRDHSLLTARAPRSDPAGLRFHLYESVSDHARTRLEDPLAVRRHGEWFVGLGEQLGEGVQGPEAADCLRRLHEEAENLRAAYDRHVDADPALAARAALALHALRTRRGPVDDQLALLERVADVGGPIGARVRLAAAKLHTARGRWEVARAHLDEAKARAGDDPLLAVDHLAGRGAWFHRQARFDEALASFSAALEGARAHGDRRREARLLGALGAVLQLQGRVPEAEAAYLEALALHRAAGNRHREATILSNLAVLRVADGGGQAEIGREQAETWFRQALAWAEQTGDVQLEGRILGNLAALHLDWGRLADAELAAARALERARMLGLPRTEAVVLGTVSRVAHLRGQLDVAERHAQAGLASARMAGSSLLEGLFLCGLAAIAAARGELATAENHHAAARTPLEASHREPLERVWRVTRGHLALARGDREEAEALLDQPPEALRSAEVRGAVTLLRRALEAGDGRG